MPINCPGTCSQGYNTGTVVHLTATPNAGSTFSSWAGVPVGHETDNPVAVTVNSNMTVTATFATSQSFLLSLLGVMYLGPGSGGFTAVGGDFIHIGNWSGTSSGPDTTVGNHQERLPIAITASRIYGRLFNTGTTAAFGSIRMNVGGVGSNTLLLTFGKPSAPLAALAGTGAGNVTNGAHSWKITFIINGVENFPSNASTQVTVVDNTTNGKVALSSITLGPTGTTARNVYRTVAGDTGNYLFVGTIPDNTTTTFTDNVADGSLGAAAPTLWLAASAIGSLAMAQDALVCYEGTAFDGGNHVNIACLELVYAPTTFSDGYIHPGKCYSTFATTATYGWLGWGNANANDRNSFLPKQLMVKQGTMVADGPAGATHSFAMQVTTNGGSNNIGSAVTLADPATSVRGTINGTLPLTTTGSTVDGNNLLATDDSGAANTTNVRPMFSFQVASPDTSVAFYSQAAGNQAFSVSSTPVYSQMMYVQVGTNTPNSAAEADTQIPVPVKGIFKYLGVKCNSITNPHTFRVVLRVNGVDSTLVVNCDSTMTWFSDLTHSVSVNPGDLVNFEFHRTDNAAADTFTPQIVIGFMAA